MLELLFPFLLWISVDALDGCGPLQRGFVANAGCFCELANGTNACFSGYTYDVGNQTHDWIEKGSEIICSVVHNGAGGYISSPTLAALGCAKIKGFCNPSETVPCCSSSCNATAPLCDNFRECNAAPATTTAAPTTAGTTTTAAVDGTTIAAVGTTTTTSATGAAGGPTTATATSASSTGAATASASATATFSASLFIAVFSL
jgi:hypothetical protein